MAIRHAAFAAAALLVMTAAAAAQPVTIFDDLGDTPPIHPEGITIFSGGAEAASFQTPNFLGSINSISLALNCSGQNGEPACASGTYGNAESVHYLTGASAGSNQLTLNGVSGVTVGSFIQSGGANNLAPGTIWVTAVNGNTVTLSQALTSAQAAALSNNGAGSGRGVIFLPQGSFTVGIYQAMTAGIPGSAATTSSIPTGTPLASFTEYDAALYVEDPAITGANPAYVTDTLPIPSSAGLPFGNLQLGTNTTYWIELTDNGAGGSNPSGPDPTNTDVGWEFLTDSGQSGNVDVTNNYWYVANYTCSSNPCSQINGGTGDTISKGAFGMDLTYAPEPGTLSILAVAVLGLGLIRRRTVEPKPAS